MAEVIKLAHPIEHEGNTYAQVTLKERFKVSDDRAVERHQSNFDRGIEVVARVTGLPFEAVLEMDVEDFEPLTEKSLEHWGKGHKAADEPSKS